MTTDLRHTVRHLRIRIPQRYHQEPILSRLVSDYHLTFNLNAAVLGANAAGDGWFNLELHGTEADIQQARIYLQDLEVEIWHEAELDGW